MSLISLEHVSKIYPKGTRPALDDISLDVNRGDFVFLVGASGSGKTTLLSLLLREEEATKGEIHVAGNDLRRLVNRQVPQYRRSLGFIFQDYKLLNNKTVYQNVAFALEVIGTSRSTIKSLVPRVLETVGLTGKENNYPHELSGGEAQRVAIARAYVNHPQILLADEPTGNLDPTTSLGIMEVLDAINRTGTTIVMATHNEEIVNSMRKRVVELHSGHIVRDEREGSYDSALYFPDADVEQKSKAQQAVEGDSISAAVADSKGDSKSGSNGESNAESNGESSSNANSQSPINANGFDESQENYRFMSKRAKRAVQAKKAMDAVAQTLQNGSENNEGIARLAQSVHSGRTGRYGEVFQPLETTMTWGRGLSIPPAPPAKKSNVVENENENNETSGVNQTSVDGVTSVNSEASENVNASENSSVVESNETSSSNKDSNSEVNKTEANKAEVNKNENLKNEGDE